MFLYYIPSPSEPVTRNHLQQIGLGYAFDSSPSITHAGAGPLGAAKGVYVANSRIIPSPDVTRDNYTWRRIPWADGPLVGLHKTKPYGPKQLARKEVLTGHPVELNDGNQWLIPIARRFDEAAVAFVPSVPAQLDIDEDGNWTDRGVNEKHKDLWEGAIRFFDEFTTSLSGEDDEGGVYLQSEFFDDASKAIESNYLVSKIEIAMMGLLTDHLAGEVMRVVSGLVEFAAYAQKKSEADSASLNSSAGDAV